jgi:hypothetical protein
VDNNPERWPNAVNNSYKSVAVGVFPVVPGVRVSVNFAVGGP